MSSVIFTNFYLDYQIKEIEMGVACRIHGRDKKCLQKFGQKPEEMRVYEFNLDGRIKLECVLKVDWIHFAQKRDKML